MKVNHIWIITHEWICEKVRKLNKWIKRRYKEYKKKRVSWVINYKEKKALESMQTIVCKAKYKKQRNHRKIFIECWHKTFKKIYIVWIVRFKQYITHYISDNYVNHSHNR